MYREVLKSAKNGNIKAMNLLADSYYYAWVYDGDYVYWYRRAAKQGYAPAQNNLGDCYFSGFGIK